MVSDCTVFSRIIWQKRRRRETHFVQKLTGCPLELWGSNRGKDSVCMYLLMYCCMRIEYSTYGCDMYIVCMDVCIWIVVYVNFWWYLHVTTGTPLEEGGGRGDFTTYWVANEDAQRRKAERKKSDEEEAFCGQCRKLIMRRVDFCLWFIRQMCRVMNKPEVYTYTPPSVSLRQVCICI